MDENGMYSKEEQFILLKRHGWISQEEAERMYPEIFNLDDDKGGDYDLSTYNRDE